MRETDPAPPYTMFTHLTSLSMVGLLGGKPPITTGTLGVVLKTLSLDEGHLFLTSTFTGF
jgi:hypothetical protein